MLDADASEPSPLPPPKRVRLDPRARPSLHAVPPAPVAVPGSETRRSVDYQNASELERLAYVLRPGVPVRVERTRPHWCAGVVETHYTLESGHLDELIDYLRDEWGGQTYRVTVLQPHGAPAFESRLTVCAPPRYEGKRVYRETWGGEHEEDEDERPGNRKKRASNPEPSRSPAGPSTFGELRELLAMMQAMHADASGKSLDAVRDIIANTRAEKEQLIQAVTEMRTQETRGGNLVEQLGEFMTAQKALQSVGKVFGAAADRKENPEEDDVMKGVLKHAAKDFLAGAITTHFTKPKPGRVANAAAPARPPARPPAREIPQNRPQMPAILDAEVAGQNRGE